jgi:hypothetical protein
MIALSGFFVTVTTFENREGSFGASVEAKAKLHSRAAGPRGTRTTPKIEAIAYCISGTSF